VIHQSKMDGDAMVIHQSFGDAKCWQRKFDMHFQYKYVYTANIIFREIVLLFYVKTVLNFVLVDTKRF